MTYMGRPKSTAIPLETRDPTDKPDELYARIVDLAWQCPTCGALWRSHQIPMTCWRVHCEMCHNQWSVGVVFRKMPPGRKTAPPDTIFTATEWRTGRRANMVINAPESQTTTE